MVGGDGGRSSPPGGWGGGDRPAVVGRFGCSSGLEGGGVRGLVGCCSPQAGAEILGGCAGMVVDHQGSCTGGGSLLVEGRPCSPDSEDMELSYAAEGGLQLRGSGGRPAEECMGVDVELHGNNWVEGAVGGEHLLQAGSPLLEHAGNVGLGFGASMEASPSGVFAGVGAGLLPMGSFVMGRAPVEKEKGSACMQGVCEIVSENISSLGGGKSAPKVGDASPRPPRSAWNRPVVVPLPTVAPSCEVRDGVERVRLDSEEVDATVKLFENAIVGRLFGRRIPFAFLNAELHRRWQGFGHFRLITVSGDCFICMFDSVESRDAVLMGGPWIIAGQVLGIDCWSPGFSPSSKTGSITPIWVRLPGLPLYCWGGKSLARIAGSLGEPIWMDAATDRIERGLFARVCIRVDLSMALKPGVWVDGPYGSFFQHVEYEGLSSFCFLCGHVGHKAVSCKVGGVKPGGRAAVPSKAQEMGVSPLVGEVPPLEGVVQGGTVGVERVPSSVGVEVKANEEELASVGFGPWMLVQRRKRPNHVKQKEGSLRREQVGGKQALNWAYGRESGSDKGLASSSSWRPWSGDVGKSDCREQRVVDRGEPFSLPSSNSLGGLGKQGVKPFSGFKARREVASLGPILDEDRRKRKKSSIDGGEVSPSVGQ